MTTEEESYVEKYPCVKCGYCCTKAPCDFGKWDYEKQKCGYLSEDNLCKIYDDIIKIPSQKWNPAFGYGCCMPLWNTIREEKIKQLENTDA